MALTETSTDYGYANAAIARLFFPMKWAIYFFPFIWAILALGLLGDLKMAHLGEREYENGPLE